MPRQAMDVAIFGILKNISDYSGRSLLKSALSWSRSELSTIKCKLLKISEQSVECHNYNFLRPSIVIKQVTYSTFRSVRNMLCIFKRVYKFLQQSILQSLYVIYLIFCVFQKNIICRSIETLFGS